MKKNKKRSKFKTIGGVLLLVAAWTVIVSVVCCLVTYFVPYISITIFQETGISMTEGLTFAEFSVGDTVVLLMMWFLPSLAAVLLIVKIIWWVLKSCGTYTLNIIVKLFDNNENKNISEGEKNNEHEISGEA